MAVWRSPLWGSLKGNDAPTLRKIFESLTQHSKDVDARFAALEQRVNELENP